MLPALADRPKLAAVLGQLSSAVEELLLSGLTTASEATRQTIAAAMQEAARFRLLRLGSQLRAATEELSRSIAQDQSFSRRRLTFFLSRAWLLSRGLSHALQTTDEKEYDRLTWSPPQAPVPTVDVVCLGVVKRVSQGAFVAFEFRLRAIADAAPIKAGQRLVWSAVFPLKPGLDIPAEGFLHLPQKQKFTTNIFLEQKTFTITAANIARDNSGDRLSLTEQSTVVPNAKFDDWAKYLTWEPAAAIERIRKHTSGPLDLDTEMQEEIILRDYTIEKPEDGDSSGQKIYPIKAGPYQFSAVASAATDGVALRNQLGELRKLKKDRPPLYGLLHYERCRLTFQPLTAFRPEPDYLPISKENINKAALLKALSFK